MDNISNVVNDILINQINQTDGVFQQEDIVIDDNIFVGEEVCNFFSALSGAVLYWKFNGSCKEILKLKGY